MGFVFNLAIESCFRWLVARVEQENEFIYNEFGRGSLIDFLLISIQSHKVEDKSGQDLHRTKEPLNTS